jgi:MbtH protein
MHNGNQQQGGNAAVPNPFDDETAPYLVIVNSVNQHSIWPESLPFPEGWCVIAGPTERRSAVQFVDDHWVDLRPRA